MYDSMDRDLNTMVFVACGLNHKTAPIEVREQIALPVAMQNTLLNSLVGLPMVNEAAILSTCNRTEIYCDTEDPDSISLWFAKKHPLLPESLAPHFYTHHGEEGIRHTLRVASGLDSMMLGEPQIFGQMKQAYQQACHAGTIKKNLRHVFQYIFGASKRIRNHSGIGKNPVSIAFAAASLIDKLFTDYQSLSVFIIGSGETASLVAKYLHKQGVKRFMIASRTLDNASELTQAFGGIALSITDIPQYLPQADIIISATTCPLPFITENMVAHALNQRNNKPMFFLDLAVPRDIESTVANLEAVHLYNIDDLYKMTEKGINARQNAAQQAEKMIECELDSYIRWYRSLQAKEIICNYRERMQDLAQQELQRALQKLSSGQSQQNVLTEFSERLINKMTHTPSVGLRQAAWDGRSELFDLVDYLFNSPIENSYEKIT